MLKNGLGGLMGLLAWTAAVCAAVSAADAVAVQPKVRPGDTWVFEESSEKGVSGFSSRRMDITIQSQSEDEMEVGVKPNGSPLDYETHTVGLDWTNSHLFNGVSTVVGHPFAFPMQPASTGRSITSTPRARARRYPRNIPKTTRSWAGRI